MSFTEMKIELSKKNYNEKINTDLNVDFYLYFLL